MERTREQFDQPPPSKAHLIWILLGPITWSIQMALGFVLAPISCGRGLIYVMHLVNLLAFLIVVASAYVNWKRWRSTDNQVDANDDVEGWPPDRWIPAGSFILSVLFAFIIVVQTVPTFIIHPCQ